MVQINAKNPAYVVNIRPTEAPAAAAATKGVAAPGEAAPKAASQDRVDISPRSREIDRLKRLMADIPEVRLEKVALAKQQLQGGNYRVDPALVAQSLEQSQRRS